jgi:hypothetical protein
MTVETDTMTYVELECGNDECQNQIDNEVVYREVAADCVTVTIACFTCGAETVYKFDDPRIDEVVE